MNCLPAPPATVAASASSWRRLGRWGLLLLIAFDLISAPFHHHGHDLGAALADSAVSQALASPLPASQDSPAEARGLSRGDHLQVDTAPPAAFGHSQALLRGSEPRPDDMTLLVLALGLALWVAAWALLEAPRGWSRLPAPTAPARRPPGLLPDGRAPPALLD